MCGCPMLSVFLSLAVWCLSRCSANTVGHSDQHHLNSLMLSTQQCQRSLCPTQPHPLQAFKTITASVSMCRLNLSSLQRHLYTCAELPQPYLPQTAVDHAHHLIIALTADPLSPSSSSVTMSLDLHVPDAFEVDSLCTSRHERYISKTLVKIASDNQKLIIRTLLLTHKTMYEFPVDPAIAAQIIGIPTTQTAHTTHTSHTASSQPQQQQQQPAALSLLSMPPLISLAATHMKEKPLTDLHSVALDPSDSASFYLYFYSGSLTHRAAIGLNRLKSKLTHHSQFNHFLKRKRYTFASPTLCRHYNLLLSKLSLYQFQAVFESGSHRAIIPAPDYYQRHAFVFKGGLDRVLLLSNTHLFNVECTYKPLAVRSIKWVIHVRALTHLALSQSTVSAVSEDGSGGGEVELIVSFDATRAAALMDSHHRSYKQGGQLAEKQWHFAFRSVQERAQFVRSMQKVYHEQTAHPLTILQQ